jgi:tryptophan 2,3-dioxygenase
MSGEKVTYSSYLRVGELLDTAAGPAAHDELLFVVIHQSHELWFKLVLHELDDAVALIDADRFPEAETRLRRIVTIMRQLVAQWDVLGHDGAGRLPAVPARARGRQRLPVGAVPRDRVLQRPQGRGYLRSPWLSDGELRSCSGGWTRRRSPTPSTSALGRYGVDDVVEVLRGRGACTRWTMLAETLLDYDEAVGHWRHRHVLAVERQIGTKPGTGGSSGAAYLRGTLTRRFFPALWEARSRL